MELIIEGYKTNISVYRRQLVIDDQTIPRITSYRRLIIFAEIGSVTLDALRWCQQQGICVTQYDRAGNIVLSVTAGIDDRPTIRYNQARASEALRLQVGKQLLTDKLDGQARIAKEQLNRTSVAETILDRNQQLGWANSISELLGYEGQAAAAYWSGWAQVRFQAKGRVPLPEHWSTFRGRGTGTGNPGDQRNRALTVPASVNRGATDPINAVLNYLYRVAETEAKHACLQYGLDPAFGMLHTTTDYRDAFALDLLEVLRPECDRIALKLFRNPVPGKYFFEAPHGVVHIIPPLTSTLAKHSLEFAAIVRPFAQNIAKILV